MRTTWEASGEPADLLGWDSAFWGVIVARSAGDSLNAERWTEIDTWAANHAVDCLYFLARADDQETVAVAQDVGFRFVDVRLEFTRHTRELEPARNVRPYRSADLKALRAIAQASHRNTRFYTDRRFPRERCDDFYDTWIVRSCEEGWADAVFVLDVDDQACGYVTCHLDEASRRGSIGLIAVSAGIRGKGLGRDLVRGALAWIHDRRCIEASVVTQGANLRAQRVFQACGFRTHSTGLWFHRWFER